MKRAIDSRALAKLKEILESLALSSPASNPNDVASLPANQLDNWRQKFGIEEIADIEFNDLRLSAIRFQNLTLRNLKFSNCDLRQASFENSLLDAVTFEKSSDGSSRLVQANFAGAHLQATKFLNCDCGGARFQSSELGDCLFVGTTLRAADFESATLTNVVFRNIEVDTRTKFKNLAQLKNVTIERYALHCLGSDFGGLTEGNRMRMDIADDALLLRGQFGGFWTLLHLSAVVVFLFPYAWFIGKQWTVATFAPAGTDDKSLPLWKALAGFILTGGGDWKGEWNVAKLSLASFVVFAIYNAARIALLWKAKNLEMKEHITGLPVEFSLEAHPGWRFVFRLVKWCFWLALLATIVNTIHFLNMRVPI